MFCALVINRKLMQIIKIKPLSINEAWKGRKYKTDSHKRYVRSLLYLLPQMDVPVGKLELHLILGLSNKNADWDNPVKIIQDALQKRYGFNDNKIYKAIVEKVDVKKGEEFIKFELIGYEV